MWGLKDLLWMSYQLRNVGLEVSQDLFANFGLFFLSKANSAKKWAVFIHEHRDECDECVTIKYFQCQVFMKQGRIIFFYI